MDSVVSSFLVGKDSNLSKLTTALAEQQDQVVESFGGITNVVQLCLTHPDASKYVDTESTQFHKLKQILHTNNTSTSTIKNSSTDSQTDHNMNSATESNYNNKASSINNANYNDKTLISRDNHYQSIQIVNNAAQYKDSRLIIDCNPKYSLLFRWIQNANIALSLYNVILNRKSMIVLLFLSSICGIVMFIHLYIVSMQTAFVVCKSAASFIIACYCISMLLIANITLVDLITSTFDFWFKVYNTIMFIGAIWVRSYETNRGVNDNPIWNDKFEFGAQVMMQIGVVLAIIVLILIDAIPLSIHIKRAAIGLYAIVLIYDVAILYFLRPDFEWNPFNSKYTQISFKSIIISSEMNIILFMVKPVLSDTIRHLKRCISVKIDSIYLRLCSKSDSTDYDIKENSNVIVNKCKYQRCGTVYKRPYLKWNTIKSEKDEFELNKIVSK